jgi:hypothetical protein
VPHYPLITPRNTPLNTLRPVLLQVLSGFNACILAYGQTGSGKTFTMIGAGFGEGGEEKMDSESDMAGLMPRVTRGLFDGAKVRYCIHLLGTVFHSHLQCTNW